MEIPDISSLNCNTIREKYIKNHYKEFYDYLIKRYKNIEWKKFSELLYLFSHNMNNPPCCAVCGSPVKFINITLGYHKTCSYKCAQNNSETKEKLKQTNLERYGVENYSQYKDYKDKIKQTNLKRYGVEFYASTEECKDKHIKTYLKKYGVENPMQLKEFKDKLIQTNLKRYGVKNYAKTEECKNKMKQTNLERYGVDHYSKTNSYKKTMSEKTSEIQQKMYITKKKNHTFGTSKIEKLFQGWLDKENIIYEYQYKNKEKYPFNCDFYFPEKDLYLEIQGNWTHGGHPFDENNKHDLFQLDGWKNKNTDYYNTAINIWTIRDPLKRETAKKNNLNWIEVFTSDINVLIDKVKDIL